MCHFLQEHWPASRAEVCCCPRSYSCCCILTPGTFANQGQAASGSRHFWGLLIPGLSTSLSQRRLCSPDYHCSVSHRLSSAPCGHRHPCNHKGARSVGLTRWVLAWEVLRMLAPSPVNTMGGHACSLLLRRS
uniref:Uncharacterized protein n=1 Tax=Molossus molossus TaxID=27622 RepID=A0A7J8FTL6_MOLMO|nr:hypothetical protein HJG59_008366 [Molossus molossus]